MPQPRPKPLREGKASLAMKAAQPQQDRTPLPTGSLFDYMPLADAEERERIQNYTEVFNKLYVDGDTRPTTVSPAIERLLPPHTGIKQHLGRFYAACDELDRNPSALSHISVERFIQLLSCTQRAKEVAMSYGNGTNIQGTLIRSMTDIVNAALRRFSTQDGAGSLVHMEPEEFMRRIGVYVIQTYIAVGHRAHQEEEFIQTLEDLEAALEESPSHVDG